MLRYRPLALIALALTVLLLMPGSSQAQTSASVTGIVTIRERIALPATAIVTIQLADISRVGAPAQIIAEQTFSTSGAQSPFSFALPYDPNRIILSGIYSIQGNIRYNNAIQFTTTSVHRVITQGNPTSNVMVVMAGVGGGNLPNTAGGNLPLLIGVVLLIGAGLVMFLRRRIAFSR